MNPGNPHQKDRMKGVRAGPAPNMLTVTWTDGSKDKIDLTGLITRDPNFRVFEGDSEAFQSVSIADWGYTVEWDNGLDWPAPNLKRLAEEQRLMTGTDLIVWQKSTGLSNQEAADVLGVDLKTVKNWRIVEFRSKPLPTAAQWSLRHLMGDPLALMAHYRPRRAGRPKLDKQSKATN
jgi:DNA-binding transcriptional regulator YiaG